MHILMGTVMAKLVVTSIVEEIVHVELQAALFDMLQGGRGRACSKPPRASRTAPGAAALGSRSQHMLGRTVVCPFP